MREAANRGTKDLGPGKEQIKKQRDPEYLISMPGPVFVP